MLHPYGLVCNEIDNPVRGRKHRLQFVAVISKPCNELDTPVRGRKQAKVLMHEVSILRNERDTPVRGRNQAVIRENCCVQGVMK